MMRKVLRSTIPMALATLYAVAVCIGETGDMASTPFSSASKRQRISTTTSPIWNHQPLRRLRLRSQLSIPLATGNFSRLIPSRLFPLRRLWQMFLSLLQQHRSVENGFALKPGEQANSVVPSSGVCIERNQEKILTSPLWKRKLGLEFRSDLSRSSSQASGAEDYFDGRPESEEEDVSEREAAEEQKEMHFQQAASNGPSADREMPGNPPAFIHKSSSLPFGQDVDLSSIGSTPTYLTALTLLQQVVFTLSDQIFTYSPDTFDLDIALNHWKTAQEKNAFGYTPSLQNLETRAGSGSLALGYVFSPDFDLEKRHIPQTVVASSSTLIQMQPALDQLSLLYSLASPFVAHIAAGRLLTSGASVRLRLCAFYCR